MRRLRPERKGPERKSKDLKIVQRFVEDNRVKRLH